MYMILHAVKPERTSDKPLIIHAEELASMVQIGKLHNNANKIKLSVVLV